MKETIQKIFEKILIDYNFQFPISWVWIGVNGAFLTGRFELSKTEKRIEIHRSERKAQKIKISHQCDAC